MLLTLPSIPSLEVANMKNKPKLTKQEYQMAIHLIHKFGPRNVIDLIIFLAYESEVVQ